MIAYVVAPPIMPEETETHGWLFPANEKTPSNACGNTVPSNALLFLFGSNAAWTTSDKSATVLQLGKCTSMTMTRDGDKLKFDADVFDNIGDLLFRIRENEFHLVSGHYSYRDRSADRSTIVVFDSKGAESLYLHYLNPNTIRVRGRLACDDGTAAVITDDDLSASSKPPSGGFIMDGIHFRGTCKGNFTGGRAGLVIEPSRMGL